MGQAVTLKYLGQARHAAGDDDAARKSWIAALAILEKLRSDADVAEIQAELAALQAPPFDEGSPA
jgi:hypothetical protein